MPEDSRSAVIDVATRAKAVCPALRQLTTIQKNAGLTAAADALIAGIPRIVEANKLDTDRAAANGTSAALIDRLTLTPERITAIAEALRELVALRDPVGEVVRGYTLPNGLEVRQVRVPFGVIGMIYEARPNVTVDAAGLCLKSGNAVLLRGSASAMDSNLVLVDILRTAIASVGIPADAIQLVPGMSHDSVDHLMTARGYVDLLIPRGGASLIQSIVQGATVSVIETGVGNCHVYVDAEVDVDQAVKILLNAKASRVSVCNAAETFLVHRDAAATFLPVAMAALRDAGVTVHGDESMRPYAESAGTSFAPVTDEDWAAEYYSLDIAGGVVDSIEDAMTHIQTWSSGHTEAILSTSAPAIRTFLAGVDSAAVMVNASTRFTDGGEFGFGAEIGISTQKLHARGPMGLTEITTTTYIVTGDGQVR